MIKPKCLAIPWHPVAEGHDRLETEQDGLTQEALQQDQAQAGRYLENIFLHSK